MDTSIPIRDLCCVQFPGIVKNVDKMLEMIGGVEKLLKSYKSQQDRLELRFRPNDDYCRGVYGDKVIVDQVLVKIIRKTKKYSDGSKSVSQTAQIIGICRCCYMYTSLMDFQYLPMERMSGIEEPRPPTKKKKGKKSPVEQGTATTFHYKSIVNEVIPSDPFDPSTNYEMNESAPLHILPALFSRFDRPSINYDYKDNDHKSGKMKELSSRLDGKDVIAKTRKSRSLKGFILSWKDEVPQECKPEALELLKGAFVDPSVVDRVKDQFNVRPVWSKAALKYHSKSSDRELKVILPTIAYNVVDGPFRCMWVKLGFDPKLHPLSAPFQSIDYRVKLQFAHRLDRAQDSNDVIQAKRSVYQYQLPLMKSDPKGKRRFRVIKEELDSQSEQLSRSSFIFEQGLIPMNRICFYQLIDIDLPVVKELISQNIPEDAVCTEKDGWYSIGSLEKVRKAMNVVMDKMMGDKGKMIIQPGETSIDNSSQAMIGDDDSEEQEDEDDCDDPEYNPSSDV